MSLDAWLAGSDVQRAKNGIESGEHPVGRRAPESGSELDEPPPDDDGANRKGSEPLRERAEVRPLQLERRLCDLPVWLPHGKVRSLPDVVQVQVKVVGAHSQRGLIEQVIVGGREWHGRGVERDGVLRRR